MKASEEIKEIIQKIKTVLIEDYEAEGDSLQDLAKNVENKLSTPCMKNIMHIALTYENAADEDESTAQQSLKDIRSITREIFKEFHFVSPKRVYYSHSFGDKIWFVLYTVCKCAYITAKAFLTALFFVFITLCYIFRFLVSLGF